MRIRLALMVMFAALAFHAPAQGPVQGPVRGGPLPLPLPLFPSDNWWNTDVTGAPVDPNSTAFLAFVGATRGMHPDFARGSRDPSAPIDRIPDATVSGHPPL